MIESIIAICAGAIAAAPWIVARKPEAADIIDKMVPYQGFLGLLLLFWSIKGLFGGLGSFDLIHWARVAIQFIVGFTLSYGLIKKYVLSKNDAVEDRALALRKSLMTYQVPAGLALMVMGILSLLF